MNQTGSACVIGAGPTGLLTALRIAVRNRLSRDSIMRNYGNVPERITVFEKRRTYTRSQVLWLTWNTVQQLPEQVRHVLFGPEGPGCLVQSPPTSLYQPCVRWARETQQLPEDAFTGRSVPIHQLESALKDYIQTQLPEVHFVYRTVTPQDIPNLIEKYQEVVGCDGRNSVVVRHYQIKERARIAGYGLVARFRPRKYRNRRADLDTLHEFGIDVTMESEVPQKRFRAFRVRPTAEIPDPSYAIAVQLWKEEWLMLASDQRNNYNITFTDLPEHLQDAIEDAAALYGVELPRDRDAIKVASMRLELYRISHDDILRWEENERGGVAVRIIGDAVMGTNFFTGRNFNNDVLQVQAHLDPPGGPFYAHPGALFGVVRDLYTYLQRTLHWEGRLAERILYRRCLNLSRKQLTRMAKHVNLYVPDRFTKEDLCGMLASELVHGDGAPQYLFRKFRKALRKAFRTR